MPSRTFGWETCERGPGGALAPSLGLANQHEYSPHTTLKGKGEYECNGLYRVVPGCTKGGRRGVMVGCNNFIKCLGCPRRRSDPFPATLP